ncbi:MAG: ATP phosphoribosyltransferase regulatory subunit, partial [Pseudomonadota bacterium]|nr:ATP phosphoribosyltransferase regulatory subunit [Pseudomonadota bacterium]
MPNWLLPENIADVLPSEARKIEELRRSMLDNFRRYGYELVMPPMLEYLESLLTGAGADMN